MGRVYDAIDERLTSFLDGQHVFFVATAPSGDSGHINLSPKGLAGTFAVLGPHRVAYLDLTGSGVETIAHLGDNGRIVVMFCAFEGPPRIVRLHGRGRTVLADDPEFGPLMTHFSDLPGTRSVIVVDVERVADSCGFGIPRFAYRDDRDDLTEWAERKGPDGLVEYRRTKNGVSIDGLPALG